MDQQNFHCYPHSSSTAQFSAQLKLLQIFGFTIWFSRIYETFCAENDMSHMTTDEFIQSYCNASLRDVKVCRQLLVPHHSGHFFQLSRCLANE
jgi:hypothetical protein